MGMDAVELIMNVEEAFAITIKDPEAANVKTVQDLLDIVRERVGRYPRTFCATAAAFYRLRRAFEAQGVAKREVRPNVALRSLRPDRRRRVFWERVERHASLRLPTLRRPAWLARLGVLITIVGAAVLSSRLAGAPTNHFWLFVLLLIALGWLVARMTRPLAIYPEHCQSVADLARAVAAGNHSTLCAFAQASSEREIWTSLRRIIAMTLDVREHSIEPGSRFVQDLNVD